MKKNVKGFMLVETLVVSTLVSTILIVLYVQFNNVVKNFNKSFHYNSVNNLYATNNIKKFILQDADGVFYENLKGYLNDSIAKDNNYYLTIKMDCSGNSNNSYQLKNCTVFKNLTDFYDVKEIIFTMEYVDLKDSDYEQINDKNFEKFIKNIKSDNDIDYDKSSDVVYDYRIIIKFANNEYATLKISNKGDIYGE